MIGRIACLLARHRWVYCLCEPPAAFVEMGYPVGYCTRRTCQRCHKVDR